MPLLKVYYGFGIDEGPDLKDVMSKYEYKSQNYSQLQGKKELHKSDLDCQ
jgi:hypothetical protein